MLDPKTHDYVEQLRQVQAKYEAAENQTKVIAEGHDALWTELDGVRANARAVYEDVAKVKMRLFIVEGLIEKLRGAPT